MLATPADAAVATVLFSHPRRLLFACARSAGGSQSTTAFLCTSLRTDMPIRYATLVGVTLDYIPTIYALSTSNLVMR